MMYAMQARHRFADWLGLTAVILVGPPARKPSPGLDFCLPHVGFWASMSAARDEAMTRSDVTDES